MDAYPICIDSYDPDEIVRTIQVIARASAHSSGDIKAPECFYIEDKLKELLDIPVYHDDQHGTAVAVLAGLYNALKIVNKSLDSVNILINGAGASGIAIAKLLLALEPSMSYCAISNGAIVENDDSITTRRKSMAKVTNRSLETGPLEQVIKGKDVFIGASVEGVLTKEMVQTMNRTASFSRLPNRFRKFYRMKRFQGGARIVATADRISTIRSTTCWCSRVYSEAPGVRAADITDEIEARRRQRNRRIGAG